MNVTSRTWVPLVVAALLGGVIGGGVVWALDRSRIARLEARVAEADTTEAPDAELDELRALVDERDLQIEQLAERVNGLSAKQDVDTDDAEKDQKQFAFIRRLTYGRTGEISADYAEFLMGTAAADAAAKAGEESPPPNDYFIVNDNPSLRTLKVAANAKVRLSTKPGEGPVVDGYDSDVKTLAKYFSADREEWASFKANGYWLTIRDGLVVGIEEQYTP